MTKDLTEGRKKDLKKLDAEISKTELLAYLSSDDEDVQMKVEFEELFVAYIKDDLSRNDR